MTSIIDTKEFLACVFPFNHLPEQILENLHQQMQFLRYRMSQTILTKAAMPTHINIIYQGQARLISFDKFTDQPVTLKLLQPGEVLGWVSHVRGIACETAIASTEVICLNLPIADFISLQTQESNFIAALQTTPSLIEVYDLLAAELNFRATNGSIDVVSLAQSALEEAVIYSSSRNIFLQHLDPQFLWLFSSSSYPEFPVGSRLDLETVNPKQKLKANMRLLGLPKYLLELPASPPTKIVSDFTDIPYESDITTPPTQPYSNHEFPFINTK